MRRDGDRASGATVAFLDAASPRRAPTPPRLGRYRDRVSPSARPLRRRAVETVSPLLQRLPSRGWAAPTADRPGAAGALAAFVTARDELTAGRRPDDLAATLTRILERADAALARGDLDWTTEWFDEALQLAFHPTVHHSYASSPVLAAPEDFLAPFRESETGRRLLLAPDPVRAEHAGGPRALAACHSSWTFLDRLVEATGAPTGPLSWSRLDLAALPPDQRPAHRRAVRARARFALTGERPAVPDHLARHLESTDTLFVEWGAYPFAWLSLMDLGSTRLVCRLHRYEGMTPYPLLADFANVDEMLLISPSVRDALAAATPRLAQAHRVSTVRNPHDYTRFTTTKEPGAERTLIQVGWATPVKDVLFTLDVLESLRQEDPGWRLILVGPRPAHSVARDEAYACEAEARIADLGDAVEVLGRRDDVPDLLRRAGFILSSSRHEGTHESVAEGAAAACVPVVRAWPDAERWAGGARSIYPETWIVADREAAARRILDHAEPTARERAGLEASAWVAEHLRPEDVPAPYVDAVLGRHQR